VLNVIVIYRVADAKAVVSPWRACGRHCTAKHNWRCVPAVVSTRELDTFLTETDGGVSELADMVRVCSQALGVELIAVRIRDLILPGELE